jgi:hypothetical protein
LIAIKGKVTGYSVVDDFNGNYTVTINMQNPNIQQVPSTTFEQGYVVLQNKNPRIIKYDDWIEVYVEDELVYSEHNDTIQKILSVLDIPFDYEYKETIEDVC